MGGDRNTSSDSEGGQSVKLSQDAAYRLREGGSFNVLRQNARELLASCVGGGDVRLLGQRPDICLHT
jgi:hypothetical protein